MTPRPVETPEALGRAIRDRRRSLGLRQSEVAMQSGVSAATVSAVENGKDTARIGMVLRLARDLGIRLSAEAP